MSTNNRAALEAKVTELVTDAILLERRVRDGSLPLSNFVNLETRIKDEAVEALSALLRQAERKAELIEVKHDYTIMVKQVQALRDDPDLMWHQLLIPLVERIAELDAALVALQVGPQGASESHSDPQVGGEQVMLHTSEPTDGSL